MIHLLPEELLLKNSATELLLIEDHLDSITRLHWNIGPGLHQVYTVLVLDTAPICWDFGTEGGLIAVTWELTWYQEKVATIHTDTQFALVVVQAHGAIWKEQGLLPDGDRETK